MGLLFERPAAGIMRVATSPGPGGIQLRRLALPARCDSRPARPLLTRFSAALGIEELAIALPSFRQRMAVVGLLVLVVTAVPLNRVHEPSSEPTQTRNLFEQAPDGIFVADLDGRYTDVNEAGCRMLGYAREELSGKTIIDLLPPEDVERLWQARGRTSSEAPFGSRIGGSAAKTAATSRWR